MSVSGTGDGLSVLINCEYVPHHDWMSFLCWYSLRQNLPDATVAVACLRKALDSDILNWTRRCQIPLVFHQMTNKNDIAQYVLSSKKSKMNKPLLVIDPSTVCVRDFDEAQYPKNELVSEQVFFDTNMQNFTSDCKEENHTVFVDYQNGWGKFVTSSWINKFSTPLVALANYVKPGMTVNEKRLAQLWQSATGIYQSISRG